MKHLGIDIGSTTVKIAIIDEENNVLKVEPNKNINDIKEHLATTNITITNVKRRKN